MALPFAIPFGIIGRMAASEVRGANASTLFTNILHYLIMGGGGDSLGRMLGSFTMDLDHREFDASVTRYLAEVERHLPFALNDTAQDVVDALSNETRAKFDRPTRFTQNAFYTQRATAKKLEVVVKRKTAVAQKHYLSVQARGGARPQTGLEKALSGVLSLQGPVRSIIPATGGSFEAAKLDAFGNWSTGERNRVLSALGAQRDSAANSTAGSRKRAKGRASYFVPKHGLAPGVYRRDTPGGIPVRVLKVSDKAPSYAPIFDFDRVAEKTYEARLAFHVKRQMERAATKAGLR